MYKIISDESVSVRMNTLLKPAHFLLTVCSDGNRMYSAGEKFEFSKDGQRYDCECGSNEVPSCQPIFIGKYATVN